MGGRESERNPAVLHDGIFEIFEVSSLLEKAFHLPQEKGGKG
jgi:hypothetical protein